MCVVRTRGQLGAPMHIFISICSIFRQRYDPRYCIPAATKLLTVWNYKTLRILSILQDRPLSSPRPDPPTP
jgi:hypothetical protein